MTGFRRFRFNQVYRQRPMTELRDGQRQHRAHAAANDNDAHCCRAAAINASIIIRPAMLQRQRSGFHYRFR